jgi:hypothetical protein
MQQELERAGGRRVPLVERRFVPGSTLLPLTREFDRGSFARYMV